MNDPLHSRLEQLMQLATGLTGPEFFIELEELETKLAQEKLYIVVVGLFKRGKSTIINALLGKPIAPVAVTPVTAIVTLFDYGREPGSTVSFLDNRKEHFPVGRISQYVAEEENPANEKQVNYVTIIDDIPLLRLLSIVDTPGLGSVFEHNSSTTLNFIPKIDAAVYVLSADLPISRADIEFLSELYKKVPKIFFVLNKSDLLDHANLSKLLEHNARAISAIAGSQFKAGNILPVSGKYPESRSSNIQELKEHLIELARNEKTNLLQLSGQRRFSLLCRRLILELQLRLESLLIPLSELEAKQLKLARSIGIMNEQKADFENMMAGKIKSLQDEIHQSINEMGAVIKAEINQKIEDKYKEGSYLLEKEKITAFQEELNHSLIALFEDKKTSLEDRTRLTFNAILEQHSNRSDSFLNELTGNVFSLLGTSLHLIAGKFDLNAYTSFYLTLDSGHAPITFRSSPIERLMSDVYRKNKIKKALTEHYKSIIVRNASSVIYDLQYKIQESYRKFNYDLNGHLTSLLRSLSEIIEETIRTKMQKNEHVADEIMLLKEKIRKTYSLENGAKSRSEN